MKTPPLIAKLLALALPLMLLTHLPACKTMGGGAVDSGSGGTSGIGARIVNCAEQSIRDRAMLVIGQVNDIIGNGSISDGDAHARLIELGIQAGSDVIGCLLRDQSTKFGESARGNPSDAVSKKAAIRAEQRLSELTGEGWRFEDH